MTRRERLEAKLAKRQEWSESAGKKSATAFDSADRIAQRFEGGQPILVGHHSERGARRDQAKMHGAMDRGLAAHRLAEHHDGKAAGLAAQLERSIFTDDHDAVEALERRIAEREARVERLAAWNTAWKRGAAAEEKIAKKAGKVGEDLLIARLDGGEEALRKAGASKAIIAAANAVMEQGYSWIKAPFNLTSDRAEIRRDKARLEEVKVRQARHAEAEAAPGGVTIKESGEWCRVEFSDKPSREILDELHAAGYHYGGGSWQGRRAALPASVAALLGIEGAATAPAPAEDSADPEPLERSASPAVRLADLFGREIFMGAELGWIAYGNLSREEQALVVSLAEVGALSAEEVRDVTL